MEPFIFYISILGLPVNVNLSCFCHVFSVLLPFHRSKLSFSFKAWHNNTFLEVFLKSDFLLMCCCRCCSVQSTLTNRFLIAKAVVTNWEEDEQTAWEREYAWESSFRATFEDEAWESWWESLVTLVSSVSQPCDSHNTRLIDVVYDLIWNDSTFHTIL